VRDYVLANSAAALWVTGRFSLREGVALAASALDSGAAAQLLARWRQLAPLPPS
jgi:anthranilate phosphoribosyltransferase